ncbi:zinc finger CCCH domain-containing protein 13-like isoform X3 [Salvia hispanica]|uniref:zinc finger CCCH domain-containing protein 13-like isoform X3 n=1 Tax=Salvia hispanica TaxID=49212 RepID=UPI00200926DD|nr:zinc finger CCCH domain-containing protein 13-like isoform X3 [Salvia hispanica]
MRTRQSNPPKSAALPLDVERMLTCEKGSTGTVLHRVNHQIKEREKQDKLLMEMIALLGKGFFFCCSDRNVSKKRRLDDHDDYSGRMSDDKMRGTHYDKPKFQLIKEADSLTSEVHELKRKLSKEKEERERFTTNVKKFIEAHYSHLQLENELKRSQDQIKHLVAQLEADILTRRVFSSSEEDDELKKSQGDEGGPDSSSRRLRSRVEVHGKSPQG